MVQSIMSVSSATVVAVFGGLRARLVASTLILGVASAVNAAVIVPAGVASEGKALASTVCAACHGGDGNSPSSTVPSLAGQSEKYIYKQLTDFKSGKRVNAIMAGQVANLTPQQMANVAVYFSQQKTLVNLSNPATVSLGEKIYRGGDSTRGVVPCSGCHGPAGKGNRYAAFPRIGGQHADYLKAQLRAFRAAGREDITMDAKRENDGDKSNPKGPMQVVASKLSDKDIENLANFLTGLN